jgi:hypothetical protein
MRLSAKEAKAAVILVNNLLLQGVLLLWGRRWIGLFCVFQILLENSLSTSASLGRYSAKRASIAK